MKKVFNKVSAEFSFGIFSIADAEDMRRLSERSTIPVHTDETGKEHLITALIQDEGMARQYCKDNTADIVSTCIDSKKAARYIPNTPQAISAFYGR